MKKLIVFSLFVIGSVFCDKDNLKKMEEEGVIPDVIDKVPPKALDVSYNDKKVDLGKEFTPTEVKDQPKVTWDFEKDAYYTLAMVDPDAPSRKDPKFREVNHWLVANILGNDLSTGEVITAYLGSGPPKGTDLHRYVFLLYKQPKKLTVNDPKTLPLSRAHRLNFDIKKFATKYHLGDPIAGNFFKAQWDEYVDVRNLVINLETAGVIPDVIDRVPPKSIKIIYNNKKVVSGNELTPTEVKDQPKVTWEGDKNSYYTLAMVDPDAPTRKEPKFREVNHWLVTNILGNDLNSGEVITAYMGSGPPKDTFFHRYVFLLYKQPKKLTFDEPKTPVMSIVHRMSFNIRKFAEKYHLGDPIAGNFYTAQWEPYVDEQYKKLVH